MESECGAPTVGVMKFSRRWVGMAAGVGALGLAGWMVLMALRPDLVGTTASQLPLWLSLDGAEFLGLLWISVTATGHPQFFLLASTLTAGLLFCDASFDVVSSLRTGDMALAVSSALLVELPAGIVLLRAALVNQVGRPAAISARA